MIIERAFAAPLRIGAAALAVWFLGMAALALVVEPGAVVAFGRAPQLYGAVVQADAELLGAGNGFVTARAEAPGLARRLYAGGAWFVWPVIGAGCGARAAPRVSGLNGRAPPRRAI